MRNAKDSIGGLSGDPTDRQMPGLEQALADVGDEVGPGLRAPNSALGLMELADEGIATFARIAENSPAPAKVLPDALSPLLGLGLARSQCNTTTFDSTESWGRFIVFAQGYSLTWSTRSVQVCGSLASASLRPPL